jgi:hypothetical protein
MCSFFSTTYTMDTFLGFLDIMEYWILFHSYYVSIPPLFIYFCYLGLWKKWARYLCGY